MQIEDYVREYTRILEKLKESDIHDSRVAIAILRERGKDRRVKNIEERMKAEPATEKQKKYLNDLGIPFPLDLTKRQASKLIREATED